MLKLAAVLLSSTAIALAPAYAQQPAPGQLGLVQTVPNLVQVLDSSQHWATIGSIDPTLHIFTPVLPSGGGGAGIPSYQTHAVLVANAPAITAAATPIEQQGYYGPGDGGSATFDPVLASTLAADGVTVIAPVGGGGRYVMRGKGGTLPARALGVVGDAFFASDGVINGTTLTSATHSCVALNAPLGDVGRTAIYDLGGPGAPVNDTAIAASTPTVGTTALAGAAGGTFKIKFWYDAPQANGLPGVTLPSQEATIVVAAGQVPTVTSPPAVPGVRGWHVGMTLGASGSETQVDDATTYIPIGVQWVNNKLIPPSQGAVPVANNTLQNFVLQTKVDGCSSAAYTLHDAGPSLVTASANASFTTASTSISLAACPSPTPAVGTTISDQSLYTKNTQIVGVFGACSGGSLTLQANPYTGSINPGMASQGAADTLAFGQSGFFSIYTDNSPALLAAVQANPRGKITFPCTGVGFGGPAGVTVALDLITLEGCGQIGDIIGFVNGPVNATGFAPNRGTTFFVGVPSASPTLIPFSLYRSITLSGFLTFDPGQMGAQPAPVARAPQFADDGTHTISGLLMRDINFLNPFAMIVQTKWSSGWAKTWFDNIHGFIVDTAISRANQGEILQMLASNFNGNDFHGVSVTGQGYLNGYANWNGNFLVVPGNGDGTNCSTQNVGGTAVSIVNTTWHNFADIIHIAGGEFTESKLSNLGSGGNNRAIYESPLGSMANTIYIGTAIFQTSGAAILPGATGLGLTPPPIEVHGTCATSKGKLMVSNASLVSDWGGIWVDGGELYELSIIGGQWSLNLALTNPSALYAAYINDPNLLFVMSGVNGVGWSGATQSAAYKGVYPVNVAQAIISNNIFARVYNALDTSALVLGQVYFGGNSVTTAGSPPFGVNVPKVGNQVIFGPNNMDKLPTWTASQLDVCNTGAVGSGSYQITDAQQAYAATAVAVVSGGSGGNVGGTCTGTLVGGNPYVPTKFTVPQVSGAISGAVTITANGAYSAVPANPVPATLTGGSNCNLNTTATVNVTWSAPTGATWNAPVSGGGTTPAMVMCSPLPASYGAGVYGWTAH